MAKWKIWLTGAAIVIADLFVYIVIGIAMMQYDDFYAGDAAEWGAWHTLTAVDKKVFTALYIWNAVNVATVGYIIYRVIKWFKQRHQASPAF